MLEKCIKLKLKYEKDGGHIETLCNRVLNKMESKWRTQTNGTQRTSPGRENLINERIWSKLLWKLCLFQLWWRRWFENYFWDKQKSSSYYWVAIVDCRRKINPSKTLIIFDEIQECPEALNTLKYFKEKANEYHVIAAGSLLGTLLAKPKSYPVGMVNLQDIHPLN